MVTRRQAGRDSRQRRFKHPRKNTALQKMRLRRQERHEKRNQPIPVAAKPDPGVVAAGEQARKAKRLLAIQAELARIEQERAVISGRLRTARKTHEAEAAEAKRVYDAALVAAESKLGSVTESVRVERAELTEKAKELRSEKSDLTS